MQTDRKGNFCYPRDARSSRLREEISNFLQCPPSKPFERSSKSTRETTNERQTK
jgi:hypothetical protein